MTIVERYAVPRLPEATVSPDLGTILASGWADEMARGPNGVKPMQTRAGKVPAGQQGSHGGWSGAPGHLLAANAGLIFIGGGLSLAEELVATWKPVFEGLTSPIETFTKTAAKDVSRAFGAAAAIFVDEEKARERKREENLRALEARLAHERTFVFPYCDLVEVEHQREKQNPLVRFGLGIKQLSYDVVTVQTAAGVRERFFYSTPRCLGPVFFRLRMVFEWQTLALGAALEAIAEDSDREMLRLRAEYPEEALLLGHLLEITEKLETFRRSRLEALGTEPARLAVERLGPELIAAYRQIPDCARELEQAAVNFGLKG
jgi:hypothetical protein